MKRILVATDRSPCSANALARAIQLAAAYGARIRIVYAASETDDPSQSLTTRSRIVTEAQALATEITARSIDISARVSLARPAEAILAAAELVDADLIVLGAHGEPRLRDALFGTTGTHVVRHADRPVLVVQNDANEPYSRVLIAVDDARFAQPIVEAALDVAPASELCAVHAFYPSLRQTLAGQASLDLEEERQQRELDYLLNEATISRPAKSRLTARKHAVVETGDVLSVIMQETEKFVPDVVAMGTRRGATFLGSHAVDTLFWCPHDVLVVPDPERQSQPVASTVNA